MEGMDFVAGAAYSAELENRVESAAESREQLSEIQDKFFKPEGSDLKDFSPRNVIVRKRAFPERVTLVKINIIQKPLGYTDTKQEVESIDGFERWGGFTSTAVEYSMEEGEDVSVLIENFSFGKYVKLEAPSMAALAELAAELDLEESQLIEKNSAELLAEEIGKI